MDVKKINSKKSGVFLKIFETIIYLIIVNFSYLIVMIVDIQDKYDNTNIQAYKSIWYIITFVAFCVFVFNRMFQTFKLSKTENGIIIITSAIMISLAMIITAFLFRSFALPRSVILYGFIIQTFLFMVVKYALLIIYNKRKKIKRVALFCATDQVKPSVEDIFGGRNIYERIAFICTVNFEEFDRNKLKNIDKIYISNTYNSKLLDEYLHEIILMGVQICIMPTSYDLAITNSNFYLTSDLPLLRIDKIGLSIEHRIIKRIIDILFSIFGIIITSPIMLITYIVLLFNGGNAIYKQKRVTFNNKEFTIYKFRTMIVDAEKGVGAIWATENDPRITKLGSFLRKYWIDELPQLFNVLKGDMTVVGPRPERPELVEEFVKQYPDFRLRTLVKSGLTGYAQVMARYDTIPQHKLKFDLFYILNSSLLFDINIIVMTIRKMCLRFINHEKPFRCYDEIIAQWNASCIEGYDGLIYFKY